VAFSPGSKLLASGSNDKTIKIWNTATGLLQQTLEGHNSYIKLVTFSHDSTLLASASFDKTIKIWDTVTGALQQIVEVNNNVSSLLFDSSDLSLITNIGCIRVDRTRFFVMSESSQEGSGKSNWKGLAISGSWVTWNAENLLWLPPEYRDMHSDISPSCSTVAIGCPSGKVFIIGFSLNILRSYYS
jgi:WD40 repeat protein